MPELPDVEGWKRYVARHAEGRRVRRVHVRDAGVLRNTSPQGLGRALDGRRLGHPTRHGKWLVIPAGDGHLVVHFGMTGRLVWTSRSRELEDFDRVVLELDGGELRYRAQRKLGGLWWLSERGELSEVTGHLGPDAATITREEFQDRLADRRGSIKAALMDQKLLAGIGNELSDEILWRARIRPDAQVQELGRRQEIQLHRAMGVVLRASMKRGRIPDTGAWLETVRGKEDPPCPRCGTTIRTTKLAGRTSYWCPRCQR